MKQFLEYGIDPAFFELPDHLRKHPCNHPGILRTKTNDVTNMVEERTYHAITHGTSRKGDRVEIPKAIVESQSLMKEGLRVRDEDLSLLIKHTNSEEDAQKIFEYLTNPSVSDKKKNKILNQLRSGNIDFGKEAQMFEKSKNTHQLDILKKLKNAKSN